MTEVSISRNRFNMVRAAIVTLVLSLSFLPVRLSLAQEQPPAKPNKAAEIIADKNLSEIPKEPQGELSSSSSCGRCFNSIGTLQTCHKSGSNAGKYTCHGSGSHNLCQSPCQ
jgi:hypothetical protein